MKKPPGQLFVLSAPSGSGKTTVLEAILQKDRRCVRSISATTRQPRRGERNGRDYFFLSDRQFRQARRRGAFLECARILRSWYGTPRAAVAGALRKGRDVLLGVDVQGAARIQRSGLPVTTIFLLPPGLAALKRRLKGRGTETADQIRSRLALAHRELKQVRQYDYAVVNDRLEEAIGAVHAIIKAQRYRVR
ncbi:MAG: guanylate kinase [Candidatus Omnitrophica bacterium]|nr:guanylate kinase [Candidatus Omnitrophota bacterium]